MTACSFTTLRLLKTNMVHKQPQDCMSHSGEHNKNSRIISEINHKYYFQNTNLNVCFQFTLNMVELSCFLKSETFKNSRCYHFSKLFFFYTPYSSTYLNNVQLLTVWKVFSSINHSNNHRNSIYCHCSGIKTPVKMKTTFYFNCTLWAGILFLSYIWAKLLTPSNKQLLFSKFHCTPS